MTLRVGRRTTELTKLHREPSLAFSRLAASLPFATLGAALGHFIGGWAWAATALLAIPAVSTLRAAFSPYSGKCPACETTLSARIVALPDETIVGPSVRSLRCDACGIYLDALKGDLREIAFNRVSERPLFRAALDQPALADLSWGDRCVVCDSPSTRRLVLAPLGADRTGLLAGPEATLVSVENLDTLAPSGVPYCSLHGDPAHRGLEVTLAQRRVTVAFTSYASYRTFLDLNRSVLDLTVRYAEPPEAPPDPTA